MDNILLFILLNFLMFLVLSVVIVIIKLSSLGLKYFSLKIELEHHVDGNQEEEDDGFDGDDDEEDSEEDDGLIIIPMEMLSRRVSSRVAVGTALQDVAVINDGLPDGRKKEPNTCEFDVCGICLEAWASDGDHQICCLPCGHIYGMSCIKIWFHRRSYQRCPQCNISCKLKDVRLLYATRFCIAGRTLRKFPLTEEGFRELKEHMGWV